ncbi:hypothetical protein [Paenibacillus aquistagni]|uniref:hypothetical protein n=1 Tax=Paenibacillus aquistagni TaxID=1852522 RepID=UPI001593E6C1|nr:hypothetical protein [Paenibacillus aquistagni]
MDSPRLVFIEDEERYTVDRSGSRIFVSKGKRGFRLAVRTQDAANDEQDGQ